MPESVKVRGKGVPALIIVLLYVAAALLTDPRGQFPLNDDWSYTRSAFRFGTGAGMRVDEWSAPSLVGQAFYGGAIVRVFGQSFTALRLSTVILSCAIALLLWFTLAALETHPAIRWAAVLSWVFNPIQFCLAFTFMTEVPFLFFVALASFLLVAYFEKGSCAALAACAAAFGYAFLIRQMSVLFMVAAVPAILVCGRARRRRRLLDSVVFAAICSLFVAGFSLWVRGAGGATPATQRKYELLQRLTLDQVAGNAFGILFYFSCMLLPLSAAIVPFVWRARAEFGRIARIAWPVACAAVSAAGLAWFTRYASSVYLPGRAFHSRMPFLLNVLYDTGLGPVTLDPTYYGAPETPTHPGIWRAVTIIVAAAAIPLGSALALSAARVWRQRHTRSLSAPLVLWAALSMLAVAGFEIVFSHTQEGGLFDRHILTIAFPGLLLVGLAADGAGKVLRLDRTIRAWTAAAVLIASFLAWFCVAGTHDYLAWNRIRWRFGKSLLASGVDSLNASCGFEFNAWYNYDRFRARGNIGKVYYWWYDREDYVIAMAPQEGYRIVRQESYGSWVHRRPISLYLLSKAD